MCIPFVQFASETNKNHEEKPVNHFCSNVIVYLLVILENLVSIWLEDCPDLVSC